MKKTTIKNAEIQEILSGEEFKYPKYTTQIINLANQNAQGTRPSVVGQMSDLINEFKGKTLQEWEQWYLDGHPDAIDKATDRIHNMVELLKNAIVEIDKDLVRKWVEELVVVKTFAGLKFQEAIISKVADEVSLPYRLATPEEECKGIDGFVGDKPISIKPVTYKTKMGLNEIIDIPIVFYDKKKDGILIQYEPSYFTNDLFS